ncbi:MAG: EAL domain-containing protein, partial [Negativicutes bacterium]|nr:EAL domain-containing protein [Negativicutes bacterium]
CCCVVVPFKLGDKIIGALGLGSAAAGRVLTEHEIYLLHRFADMAANAIDNASMFTAYKNELLERRRTEEALKASEEKYRAIFEHANDGIFIQDMSSGKIIDANRKIQEMYGYTREEILTGKAQFFAAGDHFSTEHEAERRLKLAAAGEPQLFEWQGRRKDGSVMPVEISMRRTKIGDWDCLLAVVRDITERKEQERAIWRMAYSDALTGLPNRAHLKEFLARELENSRRGETAGAIFFVDLDDLKTINDTFGHSSGDEVIANAAASLCAEAGAGVFVARSGGDEFVVVLPGETDRQRLKDIAGCMVQKLGQDYKFGSSRTYLSASVGIALYPEDGDTVEDILKSADLALHVAKGSGKNKWCFYEARFKKEAFDNMVLKQGLREAIARKELYLNYQPLFCPHTAAAVSFEALLRWHSAEFGAVPPGKFIPLAEESGMIEIIGKWVMREACRFARKLAELGRSDIRVSVNVSPRQLVADDFVAFVRDTIRTAGINPSQIEIEITENVLIASVAEISQKLKELKKLGVHLTLDDFGSGYCSLLYLKNLPVATLKIDKSFIDGIDADEAQWRFVNSIVNMAKVQNLTVVAEGVETVAQLTKLRQCQCDYIQGYVFSRPVAETEALALLKHTIEN